MYSAVKSSFQSLFIVLFLTGIMACSGTSSSTQSFEPPVSTPTQPSPIAVTPDTRNNENYWLGADISSLTELVDQGAIFVDTDGTERSLMALLKNHGFNAIRLRTFVQPANQFGYASADSCAAKLQAYNDKEHIVAFARQVKAQGMKLLLDFHYSDTWADPNKQVLPEAWRQLTTIEDLSAEVKTYTTDVMQALKDVDALPDMVQVGNEITHGMLIHVPTATTDCYGNQSLKAENVNGSTDYWPHLASLLKAGIAGVKQVAADTPIMLHIENTEDLAGIKYWVQNAQANNVEFDILGLSAYEQWQGPSNQWDNTLSALSVAFSELSFSIVEYNPQRTLVNDIIYNLPNSRGIGTFFWEPALSGEWGSAMFKREGNLYIAKPEDFAEFDQIRIQFGL